MFVQSVFQILMKRQLRTIKKVFIKEKNTVSGEMKK